MGSLADTEYKHGMNLVEEKPEEKQEDESSAEGESKKSLLKRFANWMEKNLKANGGANTKLTPMMAKDPSAEGSSDKKPSAEGVKNQVKPEPPKSKKPEKSAFSDTGGTVTDTGGTVTDTGGTDTDKHDPSLKPQLQTNQLIPKLPFDQLQQQAGQQTIELPQTVQGLGTFITTEDEAKDTLSKAGVNPQDVDTQQGATKEITNMMRRAEATGLFDIEWSKDENGNPVPYLKFKGMELDVPTKTRVAGILGKVFTALTIIGAVYTGGAIPPMNLNGFFKSDEDNQIFEAKIKDMSNVIQSIMNVVTNKESIKDQTDSTIKVKTIEQEHEERMKDKEYKNNFETMQKKFEQDKTLLQINFNNQKEITKLMHDLTAKLPGDEFSNTLAAMNAMKEKLGAKEYEQAVKTMALSEAAKAGITPNQVRAKTVQQWEQIISGFAETGGKVVGAVLKSLLGV